jgi:hypothetical protein
LLQTGEEKKEKEFEDRTGVRKAINDGTLKTINGVHGVTFVAKDALGTPGFNVNFKFQYAYQGTFTYKDRLMKGLYVKLSVSMSGADPKCIFDPVAFIQVASFFGLKDGKEYLRPPLDDTMFDRSGWDEKDAKSKGWFIDVYKEGKTVFYPDSRLGNYYGPMKQEPAVMWDSPALEADTKNKGTNFYTAVVGLTKVGETFQWKFIACIKWGYYIDDNGKITMRPQLPVPLTEAPQQLKDAVDRWNGLKGVGKVTIAW